MSHHHLVAAVAAVATVATVCLALPVAAQQSAQTTTAITTAAAGNGLQTGQGFAKALMERDLYSSDGVQIGEIEDLVLDAEGRAVSAVIEIESRLGFTSKHVAIPYAQLSMNAADRKRATVAMTRDQLRALPGMRYED